MEEENGELAKKENRHAELVSASANIDAPYELPEGWKWCMLGDIAEIKTGKKDANYGSNDGLYPFFTCAAEPIKCNGYSFDCEAILLAGNGDISNISLYSGKFEAYQRTYVLQFNPSIDRKYVYYHLKLGWVDFNKDKMYGSTIPYIRLGNLKSYPIPFPPTLVEQQRIVNRIESMFAKLDQAQEKAQSVLDSFETRKAAILHKAFTGQLKIDNEELKTEDWEVRELDVDFDIVSGIQKTPSRVPKNNPVPYLTVANVFRDRIDLSEVRYFEVSDAEVEKLKLIEKDILVVEGNGSGNEIGRCAMWRNEITVCVHQNHIIRLRKKNDSVLPEYVLLYLNSSEGKAIMKEKAKTTAGLYNLSAGKIKTISVPYPPLNYQLSIVNFLDIVLEKESRAKEAAQTVLDQIALLKKSILAHAFRGEL